MCPQSVEGQQRCVQRQAASASFVTQNPEGTLAFGHDFSDPTHHRKAPTRGLARSGDTFPPPKRANLARKAHPQSTLAPLPHPALPARMIIGLLRSGQSVCFRARGRSMWPSIPSGSRIEVSPCPVAALEVGQVAAYEREGHVVVHRIERISPEGLHFAGDSLATRDGCIPRQQVLGRARVLERRRLRLRLPSRHELRWLGRALLRRL
jgi:hypothetical protein